MAKEYYKQTALNRLYELSKKIEMGRVYFQWKQLERWIKEDAHDNT